MGQKFILKKSYFWIPHAIPYKNVPRSVWSTRHLARVTGPPSWSRGELSFSPLEGQNPQISGGYQEVGVVECFSEFFVFNMFIYVKNMI